MSTVPSGKRFENCSLICSSDGTLNSTMFCRGRVAVPPPRNVHHLVDALRALVRQQRDDPSAHRVPHEVRPLDAQHVHELADVVDEVGEGELLLEDVADAPVQAIDGVDVELLRERADVAGPRLASARPAGAVDEDGRIAGPASQYRVFPWTISAYFSVQTFAVVVICAPLAAPLLCPESRAGRVLAYTPLRWRARARYPGDAGGGGGAQP